VRLCVAPARASFQTDRLSLGARLLALYAQLDWRLSQEPVTAATPEDLRNPSVRQETKCTIWLSYTSNMISCGVREIIRYVVQHNLVSRCARHLLA
jgi:deoxyhypusine synthase